MKMVFVVCAEGVMVEVLDILDKAGITSYTEVSPVKGVGKGGGKRLGTHAWPGKNGIIFSVVGDEEAQALVDELSRLKEDEYIRKEGLKVFIWDVERVI